MLPFLAVAEGGLPTTPEQLQQPAGVPSTLCCCSHTARFLPLLSFPPSLGKPHLLPSESKEKPAGSIDSYLKSANSWLAEKKDIAERLLKNTSAKTENVKGFFGGLETKLKTPLVRKNE